MKLLEAINGMKSKPFSEEVTKEKAI